MRPGGRGPHRVLSGPGTATSMDGGERTLVIENGTLIDGSGRAPTPNEALVIEGNRIRSVGRRPGDIRREDAGHVEVIDAAGHWIMPGLIDAHTHLSYGYPHLRGEGRGRGPTRPELGVLKAAWSAQKVLRAGVTSLSVPGGTWFTDVGVRAAISSGCSQRLHALRRAARQGAENLRDLLRLHADGGHRGRHPGQRRHGGAGTRRGRAGGGPAWPTSSS